MDNKIVDTLIKESQKAYRKGEIPVSALIIKDNKIISYAHNTKQHSYSVLGHAEINCILKASKKLKTWHLDDCDLYVTLKPCSMCQSVINNSHIKNVYYFVDKMSNIKEFYETKYNKVDDIGNFERQISGFFIKLRNK
jgi:tRNA(adenine34) deaminase